MTLGGMTGAVIVRLATNLAIPGWASYTVGILLILFVQAIMAAFVFSFAILGSRHGTTFLPRRDYSSFIGSIWTLHTAPGNRRRRCRDPERTSEVLAVGEIMPCHMSMWERNLTFSRRPNAGNRTSGVRCGHTWVGRCWRSARATAARRAPLCDDRPDRWVCLEPDSSLADRLIAAISGGEITGLLRGANWYALADLDEGDRFDTILYMDVLEHIADDRAELARAADICERGGA